MRLMATILRIARSLRFRLTLSYVLFFTIALIFIGFLVRYNLLRIIENRSENVVDEEWAATKGYLTATPYGPDWFYDPYDPDESLIVDRLKEVYFLADENGKALQSSEIYRSIGLDSPEEIKATLKSGNTRVLRTLYDHGVPYLVRSGRWVDKNKVFYLAIGRRLSDDQAVAGKFRRDYYLMMPGVIFICCLLGWFLVGRALEPLNSVSHAAQRITSSNLNAQIATRGAGDELDRLIETFNSMMERLNRSFEQIRQFSTDVSHELRTPLTVIRGQLEVALFTAKTPEQYREAMENALEEVERLSSIVRALLLLSQSETGQLVLQKSEIDLAGMVKDLVDQFQIPAEDQGVRLTADAPERCLILADRIQIERLLSNLLTNAVKYTPLGGKVAVRVGSQEDQVILEVEDTGMGIPAEHLPHIFERFYRVPSADPEKGLGLGLSFVAWIVKAHGGSIDVESNVGKGTHFRVSLPAGGLPAVPAQDLAADARGFTRILE